MGKFDGWLLVSDIDGTLVTPPSNIVSEENRAAIAEFQREGGRFTFATGRCLYGLMGLYNELQLHTPIISCNGSLIYDPIYDSFPGIYEVDKNASLDIYYYAKERLSEMGFEIFTDRKIYFIDDNPVVRDHIYAESLPYPFVSLDQAEKPWCKLTFAILPSHMEESRKVILSAPTANVFSITQSADCYLELVDQSVSKGAAVLELAQYLGIAKEHIITLGDNENDISMFNVTNNSYAVESGTENAKCAANHTVGRGGSLGTAVADILRQLG